MKKTVLTSFVILYLLFTVFPMGLSFNVQPVKAEPETVRVDNLIITTSDLEASCLVVIDTYYARCTRGQDDNYTECWNSTTGTVGYGSYPGIGQDEGTVSCPFYIYRAFTFFDTLSIPDDATITSAILSIYGKTTQYSTQFYITVQQGTSVYPHDPLVGEDYNRVHYSGNGGTFHTSGFSTTSYNNITLNSDGISWINKTGVTKFCLRSDRDIGGISPSGNEYLTFWNDMHSNFRPKLYVYWKRARIGSCDSTGVNKDLFDLSETVYVNGSGYSPSTTYDIYIVNDVTSWNDCMKIPTRVSGTIATVSSNSTGDIPPTVVWNSDLTFGKYDILVDVNGNGTYNADIDALDDNDIQVTAGFSVIPEFPSLIILPLFIIATLLVTIVHRSKQK